MTYLRYKPSKTERSSGRVVMWPIHEDIWKRIVEARKAIAGEHSSPVKAEDLI